MKKTNPWPVRKELHAHMKKRQNQNRARSIPAEDWFALKLEATGRKWTRQAQWGFRIYDFWCHKLGVAVEIDGPEHDAVNDERRDIVEFGRSCIIVLHVRNFNEDDAALALQRIGEALWWNTRRKLAGKTLIASADAPKLHA